MLLIGQKKVNDYLEKGILIDKNFIIIVGPRGMGKKYITKLIASKLGLLYVPVEGKVDDIRNLVSSATNQTQCLYHITDIERISPAAKAALLKITEEMPDNMKIVATANNNYILDTLLSRAFVIYLEPYTKEDMLQLVEKMEMKEEVKVFLYKNVFTPTQVHFINHSENILDIFNVEQKIIECINKGAKQEDISYVKNTLRNTTKEDILFLVHLLMMHINEITWNIQDMAIELDFLLKTLQDVSLNDFRRPVVNFLMRVCV
nr:MAG TPA: DNA polymerase III, delta subunit [Caudoviricetes sp.]